MRNIPTYKEFIKENVINEVPLSKFANMIDFTFIREDFTKDNLNEVIEIAKTNNFYGIVVNNELTDYLSYELDGTKIKTITVLDYPDGENTITDNISTCIESISDGADEINMVMYYKGIKEAYLKEDPEDKKSLLDSIENDIRQIANECHKNGVILKVIIESGLLNLEELVIACQIATNAGADYIQTSTGTKEVGAELIKVKEMRRILPDHVKICVAGGIRTLEQCNMYYPYVDRIATSVVPK